MGNGWERTGLKNYKFTFYLLGLEPEEGECPDLDCAESCPDGHTKDETGCDTCDCIIDCGMLMCMMECPAGEIYIFTKKRPFYLYEK